MVEQIKTQIIQRLTAEDYQPQKPRTLAKQLNLDHEQDYHAFRDALKDLMHNGRVIMGGGGTVVLPNQSVGKNEFVGSYRQNRRGFGFVVPTDPTSREDLFIPEGENGGAITGDIVRAMITNREQREGRVMYRGRITSIVERTQKRFVGSLARLGTEWVVYPDGNTMTEPIRTPDAAGRHVRPGTKVVVEMTTYADREGTRAQGVITEILGDAGEKDVDLKSVIIQYNLPSDFPDEVLAEARAAVDAFDPAAEAAHRYDLSDEVVCTIDPDDAKDYDDAISLRQHDDGTWELGVHIADVSHFVKPGSALDEEARRRGNSSYFPGHVIPMLPEILSNGVCSLQADVPRLCKSAFITYDEDARPVRTKFANTIITSRQRLRYREAQAILDRAETVPHPDGARPVSAYPKDVVQLLHDMNALAKRLQARRHEQGQIVLELPEVDLVLDEDGRVVDAVPEDQSFTHTLIEMFMVEANEAVARLLDSLDVPFLRRTHPEPELRDSERLRHFAQASGHKIDKELNRKVLQRLLASARGKPESYALNLAVLKSLTRAEYSPQKIGHYALASEHYGHFTSPIRRYADLTIHRLLDEYIVARERSSGGGKGRKRSKLALENVISYDDLIELGRHISFTERRSDDAERELRKVKILTLLKGHVGDEFTGVVTGIANFGIFIQLNMWLVEGVIRYEDLMDDWWDVDERTGVIRGERTGKRIHIGDVMKVIIGNVDLARRELVLAVSEHVGRPGGPAANEGEQGSGGGGGGNRPKKLGGGGKLKGKPKGKAVAQQAANRPRGGASRHSRGPKPRGRR